MNIMKTICPKCFKIFDVLEKIEIVKCNFCEYMYDLPRFSASDDRDRNSYLKRYYNHY